MEKLSKLLSKLIIGGVILTIAILCFIANGDAKSGAFGAISVVMGVTLLVVGALTVLASILLKNRVLTLESAGAASILALGIFLVSEQEVGGTLLKYVVQYVPYELVVVGVLLLADVVFILVKRATNKTEGIMVPVIGEVVAGSITLLLGILALTVDGIKNNKFVILGVVLLIYSVFVILEGLFTFLTVKTVVVSVHPVHDDSEPQILDVEPEEVSEDKE